MNIEFIKKGFGPNSRLNDVDGYKVFPSHVIFIDIYAHEMDIK